MVDAHHRRFARASLGFALCLALVADVGRAQDLTDARGAQPRADGNSLTLDQVELEQRVQVLKQWVADFTRWQERRNESPLAESTELRRKDTDAKPDPPAWLADECPAVAVDDPGLWGEACRLLIHWRDDALAAQIRQDIAETRLQKEAPTRTSWWRHLHVDLLWPMTQWNSRIYGVVGTHATIEVAGRFQVFMAPGIILLSLPGQQEERDYRIATDWGFAYRLFDFRFPGTDRWARVHGNLVTAWVLTGPNNLIGSRLNLAGFSFTFAPSPAP
jgi:hypothetical protein